MEDEPINQNYLIGCDTIENSPSIPYKQYKKHWGERKCFSWSFLPYTKYFKDPNQH